jgi:hypothetical protein
MSSKNIAEFNKEDNIIFETLSNLGLNSDYCGYNYLALGIKYFLEMPLKKTNLLKCYNFIFENRNFGKGPHDSISGRVAIAFRKREHTDFLEKDFPYSDENITPGLLMLKVAKYISLVRLGQIKKGDSLPPGSLIMVKGMRFKYVEPK